MELPLDRCTVRSWRPSDVTRLAREANDRSIWLNVRDRFPHPYSLADAEAFVERCAEESPECNFAITVDDQPVGAIGLILGEDIYRRTAEIGYWLGADWRGQGIGTDALEGVSDWAFTHFQLQRIFARVFTSNPASARILEKACFTLESTARRVAIKDGRVIDEWIYVRLRDD